MSSNTPVDRGVSRKARAEEAFRVNRIKLMAADHSHGKACTMTFLNQKAMLAVEDLQDLFVTTHPNRQKVPVVVVLLKPTQPQ